MHWLRLYHEVLDDPKVQQLASPVFKHWINLLCLSSKQKERGTLPGEDAIRFALRLENAEKTAKLIAILLDAELLDRDAAGGLHIHNWHGRQFDSDDVNSRVANWRANNKNGGQKPPKRRAASGKKPRQPAPNGRNVTRNVTRNDTATLHVTPPETDPETDPETECVSHDTHGAPRGGAASRPATAPRRGGRPAANCPPCPPVDALIAAVSEWAARKGIAAATVAVEAERFANYCATAVRPNGRPVEYRDHARALQNWITSPYNAPSPGGGGGGGGGKRPARQSHEDAEAEALRLVGAADDAPDFDPLPDNVIEAPFALGRRMAR